MSITNENQDVTHGWAYCTSSSEDEYWDSADTREEAIALATENARLTGENLIIIAKAIPIKIKDLNIQVSGELIVDDMMDSNDLPEEAHEWLLDANLPALEEKLATVIKEHLQDHGDPKWWTINETETLKLEETSHV